MNREIKFRGLNLNGKWVYGDLCTHYEGEPDSMYIVDEDCSYSEVDPKTVGQYLGFMGKKDIGAILWEGDIVKWICYSSRKGTDKIRYNKEMAEFECKDVVGRKHLTDGTIMYSSAERLCTIHTFEVIGNIHETLVAK